MKKAVYIVWTIIGLIILVCFAGCIKGCSEVAEGMDKSLYDIDEKTPMDENLKAGIEMATVDRTDVYEGVKTGMTKQQVLSKFGEPTKKQMIESDAGPMIEGLGDFDVDIDTKMELEYWYYGNVQISFTNGKLSGKMKI